MISLVSLNTEGTKHLPTQIEWLSQLSPDVVCLQECFAVSLPQFEALGYTSFFTPYASVTAPNKYKVQPLGEWGIALLTRLDTKRIDHAAYVGTFNTLPEFTHPLSVNRVVQVLTLEKLGVPYAIANTHFTWTPDGEANQEQKDHLPKLLALLEPYQDLVLCGDFNAPRGRETWSRLTKEFTDNIPTDTTTTIDGSKHYAGALELVVDGMFSRGGLSVSDVRVHAGVSDHCGLVGRVTANE